MCECVEGEVGCGANKEGTCPLAPPDPTPLGGVMGCSRLKDLKCKKLNSNCWCLRTTGIDAFN